MLYQPPDTEVITPGIPEISTNTSVQTSTNYSGSGSSQSFLKQHGIEIIFVGLFIIVVSILAKK